MIGRSYKEVIAELITKMGKLWEQSVTNSAQFEELRKATRECLADFRHAVETCEARIQRIEKERTEKETRLLTKIEGLEERLNMLSEQALHRAVETRAERYVSSVVDKTSEKYVAVFSEWLHMIDLTPPANPASLPPGGKATTDNTRFQIKHTENEDASPHDGEPDVV